MDNNLRELPPTTEDLMQVMNFDEEDLSANRRHELSRAQRATLSSMRQKILYAGIGLFFFFVIVATTFLFFGQQNDSMILLIVGILLTLCNAIVMGLLGRQWMRLTTDLRLNQAEVIEGQLERIIRPTGRVNNYVIRVEGQEFAVKKELFKLLRHEEFYRLYTTPYANVLLSTESLQ